MTGSYTRTALRIPEFGDPVVHNGQESLVQAQQDAAYRYRLYQADMVTLLAYDEVQRALAAADPDLAQSSLVKGGIQAGDATRIVWLHHYEQA